MASRISPSVTLGIGLVLLAVPGCSREQVDAAAKEAAEAAVRNVTAVAGAAEFERRGTDLDGRLTCESTADSNVEKIRVTCTGRTTSGQPATLEGEATRPSANASDLKGGFTGKVAGKEVFRKDCIGTGC
jgi:hypothetical protein